jgi:hypothetical protein
MHLDRPEDRSLPLRCARDVRGGKSGLKIRAPVPARVLRAQRITYSNSRLCTAQ